MAGNHLTMPLSTALDGYWLDGYWLDRQLEFSANSVAKYRYFFRRLIVFPGETYRPQCRRHRALARRQDRTDHQHLAPCLLLEEWSKWLHQCHNGGG